MGIADWARVSPGIIGATVVAFGTSSPELSVSIGAALRGTPQISLGDALGSNVVNVALILGAAVTISDIKTPRKALNRDFTVAILAPVITFVLLLDGMLSRIDGLLLVGMFVAWFITVIIEARKQRSAAEKVIAEHRGWLAATLCVASLAFLAAASHLVVSGAKGIAVALGLNEFIIGATVVAVGTSVPELATTVVAKLRGHDEISLGTILGSNIFNGRIHHRPCSDHLSYCCGLAQSSRHSSFGLVAAAFSYPTRRGLIERRRGVLLLALYASYLLTILL